MSERPPYDLLLTWMGRALEIAPETEPVAPNVIWNDGGVITLSVGIPPVITDQPDDDTAADGETAAFSLTATNATSYQWQLDSGSGFANISDATSSSYTTPTLTVGDDGNEYRCVVTGAGGSVTSNSATLTISSPLLVSDGLVAVWPMDEGSGYYAANEAVDVATIDNNLWHAPECALSHQTDKSGSATVTDEYAAAPDTRTRAARFIYLGSGSVTFRSDVFAVTPGQHTFSFKYKRTGGSDQTFKSYAEGLSGILTATGTWQTHTQTFTAATSTPTVGWYSNGATAADILIAEVKLETGGSATAYKAPQSHLVFQSGKKPTWSAAGIVTGAANLGGLAIRNVNNASIGAMTYYHAFKQSGSPETNYNALSHMDITLTKWIAGPGGTAGYADFRILNGTAQQARGTKPWDGSWHVICAWYDGTTVRFYLDGVLTRVHTLTSTFAAAYLRFFSLFTQGFGAQGTHGYAAWFDAAHTPAVIVQNTSYIRAQIAARGETFTAKDNIVVFEGDSIFEGIAYAGLSPVPERSMPNLPASTFVANVAKSGSTLPSSSINTGLSARASIIDTDLECPADNHVLCLAVGTNDLASTDAATFLTNLKAYCAARRTAGWKVVVGTVLPCTTSGFNAKRATVNTEIRVAGNLGVYWDAVADQSANTTVGDDGDELNATYYPDGVHPSNAACALLEPYWTAAATSLIT